MRVQKLFLVFIVTTLVSLSSYSQCNDNWTSTHIGGDAITNPLYKPGWHLINYDEFSGSQINEDFLVNREGQTSGGAFYVEPDNVTVSNGTAKLNSVIRNAWIQDPNNQEWGYYRHTGSWLSTIDSYGPNTFWEIRCKRNGRGFKSSFWTYFDRVVGQDTLVSMVSAFDKEFHDDSQKRRIFFEYWDDGDLIEAEDYYINSSYPNQDAEWYTYSLDRRSDAIKYYLNNNVLLNRVSDIPQFSSDINVWISTEFWLPDHMTQIEQAGLFPGKFEIDYFRLYERNSDLQYFGNFGVENGWSSQNDRPRFVSDIDGDGKDDIIGFGYYYTQAMLSTSGVETVSYGTRNNLFNDFTKEQGWTNQDERPRFMADLNADGKDDIIGFGYLKVRVRLSQSSGGSISFTGANSPIQYYTKEQSWTNQNVTPRCIADINGDGKKDIVGFGPTSTWVNLSNCSSTNVSFGSTTSIGGFSVANGWTTQDERPRFLADVNGDGKDDIVGFGYNSIQGKLSQCTSTTVSFSSLKYSRTDFTKEQGFTSQETHPRFLADINGDSKADIVGFKNGTAYASLSTSTSTSLSFAAPVQLSEIPFGPSNGWVNQNEYPRYLVDMNSDGKSDVIGFNENMIQASISGSSSSPDYDNYNNVFDDLTQCRGWSDNNIYPRRFGDVNGDGNVDIVGFGYGNGYVYPSLGGVYNLPFTINSSTTGLSDDWDVNFTDGSDASYKFYLPVSTAVTVSTCYPETNFSSKFQIFDEQFNSEYYKYVGPCTSGTEYTTSTLSEGYYYVVVDGISGQTGDFRLTVREPTAKKSVPVINDVTDVISIKEDIMLYPNPASSEIQLKIPSECRNIEILSIEGKSLKMIEPKELSITIDISDLNNNIYVLKIIFPEQIIFKKFLKVN